MKTNLAGVFAAALAASLLLLAMGCPPVNEDTRQELVKTFLNGGCRGCDTCYPEEGEGEGEGESVEGEVEGESPAEGEVEGEGETTEGEVEGESSTEGEGEPAEGESPAEGEGETLPSCAGYCDSLAGPPSTPQCYCDSACVAAGDCCDDAVIACPQNFPEGEGEGEGEVEGEGEFPPEGEGETSSWQNGANPLDTSGDGLLTAVDALLIINDINAHGSRELPDPPVPPPPPPYFDVNGDGFISPLDALLVINYLNLNPNPKTLPVPDNVHFSVVVKNLQDRVISEIAQGETFLVEVTVENLSPTGRAVFAAYLDLKFDSMLLMPQQPAEYGPDFPNGHSGTWRAVDSAGELNEGGAFDGATFLQPGPYVLFTVQFTAVQPGSVVFAADPADEFPAGDVLVFGKSVPETISSISYGTASLLITPVEGEGEPNDGKPSLSKYYVPFENSLTPDSPSYTLPIVARDIPNWDDMDGLFHIDSAETLISQNGFALLEYDWTQYFFDVEENDDIILPYQFLSEANVPVFISADTLLHLYHVQFDESLKEVEETEFIGDITQLTDALLQQAEASSGTFDGDLKEAAKRNVAFLSVAARLLDESAPVPGDVTATVDAEQALIAAHAGFATSPLFLYEEDYSQYVPRGHYTRSEALEKYFRTLMWYGRMTFLLKGNEDYGPSGLALISLYDADIQTLQAVLLARALDEVTVPGGRTGREVWDRLYAVTAFYVGVADDLTPFEYIQAANTVFGTGFDVAALTGEGGLFSFRKELAQLHMPQIYGGTGNIVLTPPITPDSLNEALAKTQGMRFMGQRFIPDSYMFQHLVFPEVLDYTGTGTPFTLGDTGGRLARCYPRGLDVMAVMGSARALEILTAEGDTEYVDFDKAFGKLQAEFAAFDTLDWNRNLYWGWLYALKKLTEPCPEGYPSFMRTPAWQDKELNAASASWTELRHDTILYAKQSYTPGETSIPDPPPGYVEPVPEFYGQLLTLTRMTRDGLLDLDALSPAAATRLNLLGGLLETLIAIANKQLTGEALSEEEILFITGFAVQLEAVVLGVSEQGVKTTLVADVHTHGLEGLVVEEGVGEVDLIVAACPAPDGSIYLAAGPALSYYEFKHPMGDRLTDEAWRSLLASAGAPKRPPWVAKIMP